jgi:hypothetical protein
MKKYDYNRTHLAWEKNPSPEKITNKMVKYNDIVFNPILQKYNDDAYDKSLRQKEKSAIISSIITNQDNQLKKEQTFNIINLQDRLKGFEKHPNYPVKKDLINKRKNINYDKKNYNILSNLPLSEHHYDKPENRPKYTTGEYQHKPKYCYKFMQDRDFDIISTKYKNFNDEKVKVDKEIAKIQTAKIFYKNNDYNPVKGVYFNQAKEQAYQEKIKEEQKNWGKEKFKNMPKCAKGKSDVYNLISLNVVDPKEFNKILKDEKDKKKRYELRNKIENYYREKNLINQDKENDKLNYKDSYFRYKELDNRQYDIIDLKDRPYKENAKKMKKQKFEGWEKILHGAGENNTFKSKSIYKDPYDYSDSGLSYDNFKKNRNKTLSSLPKIEEDKLFTQKKKISKCDSFHNAKKSKLEKKYIFNKEKFFKEPPKNMNLKDSEYESITKNKDNTGRDMEYEFNKEKNMRNLRKYLDFETAPSKK